MVMPPTSADSNSWSTCMQQRFKMLKLNLRHVTWRTSAGADGDRLTVGGIGSGWFRHCVGWPFVAGGNEGRLAVTGLLISASAPSNSSVDDSDLCFLGMSLEDAGVVFDPAIPWTLPTGSSRFASSAAVEPVWNTENAGIAAAPDNCWNFAFNVLNPGSLRASPVVSSLAVAGFGDCWEEPVELVFRKFCLPSCNSAVSKIGSWAADAGLWLTDESATEQRRASEWIAWTDSPGVVGGRGSVVVVLHDSGFKTADQLISEVRLNESNYSIELSYDNSSIILYSLPFYGNVY